MSTTKYKFKLHINPYQRESWVDDLRYIEVSGICLASKLSKHGGYKISKFVKKQNGKFHPNAGSIRYPELVPMKRGVTLEVENFPKLPILGEHDLVDSGCITISDIEEYNS